MAPNLDTDSNGQRFTAQGPHLRALARASDSSVANPHDASLNVSEPLSTSEDSTNENAVSERQVRILILSSNTGGGHRASAQALQAAFEDCHPGGVKVNIVDFWVDLAKGPFTLFPQQYSFLAKHPFLWKLTYEFTRFPPGRLVTETLFGLLAHRNIRDAFKDFCPDLIVSVHPLVNTLSQKVLEDLRNRTQKPSPAFVTVVTDLGGAHPTWFHRAVDMVYVPSDGVRKVAQRCGLPGIKIQQYGLPVRSSFWEGSRSKEVLRKELGLKEGLPAVLLVGGGDGVGRLGRIAKVLAETMRRERGPNSVQIVVICGKNVSLLNALKRRNWPVPVLLKGYVNNMSDWMSACDILCSKAGPGTIAEATIRGIPLLLTGFLPGQEEANVRYVVDSGAGVYAARSKKIAAIVSQWIAQPEMLEEMAAKCSALGRPQASREIARDILEVCEAKRVENEIYMENMRRIDIVKQHLARAHMQGRAYADRQVGDSRSAESLLLKRVRILLRVVFGALIAREAISYPANTGVSF